MQFTVEQLRALALRADTTPEALRARIEMSRRMSGAEKFHRMCQMTEQLREEIRGRIADRHPEYTAEQIRFAEFKIWLGARLFNKAYPKVEVPDCGACCRSLRLLVRHDET